MQVESNPNFIGARRDGALHGTQLTLKFGCFYTTLSLLTSAVSKGRRSGQSGSNECFFQVQGSDKRSNSHQGHKTTSGNAPALKKALSNRGS